MEKQVVTNKIKDSRLKKIEDVRKSFVPFYYKSEKIERIIFAVGLIIIFFAWLGLPAIFPNGGQLITTLMWVSIAVVALGLLVYAIFAKKTIRNRAQVFFSTYYKESNNYVFDQKGVKKLIACEPPSIQKEQFDENLLFNGVYQVNSKGYSTFIYNNLHVSVADTAAMIRQSKKVAVAFTGKYLFAESKYTGKGKIIIYLKGEGITLPPTNVEKLKKVVDNKTMTIYTANKNWNKVITPKILSKINNIKTNKLLIDLSICLVNKKQYICMGYDDPLMVPPFEKEFDTKPIEQYKSEVAQILSLMEAL